MENISDEKIALKTSERDLVTELSKCIKSEKFGNKLKKKINTFESTRNGQPTQDIERKNPTTNE